MTAPYASASLYVGDLHPDVTEALIFEIFREVGPVVSTRICRDAITRRSLGYGYVNFQNPTDAERALDTLNYTLVKDRPMRIMWSHRDPSIRKSGVGNIFIKNLDKSIDNKALYDTFSAFGNILSCKVATDDKNASKGYGFVHYETQEAAEQSIAKVNGMLLNDKKVYVGPFIRKSEREKGSDGEKKFTNVFVKNLDEAVSEDQLKKAFEPFGAITKAAIMTGDDGKSLGFGFINYDSPESAKRAVEAMHNTTTLGAKPVWVGRAQKKAERAVELRQKFEQLKNERMNKYQGVNLYVKNLDDMVDDDMLMQEFSQFGAITSAKVMRDDKTNTSRGFGFICFTAPEEATKALAEMNGRMFGNKPIYCALAQRKEVRKAQLEAQHAQRAGINLARGPVQPGGMPAAAMYPVFYPQAAAMGGMPPQARGGPQGYVFAPQMGGMPRQRAAWPGAPRPGGPMEGGNAGNGGGAPPAFAAYPMPAYPMPMSGMPGAQRGGRGGARGGGQRGGAIQNPGATRGGMQGGPATRGGNFKYNRGVRNQRMPGDQMGGMPGMIGGPHVMVGGPQGPLSGENGQEPLSVALLAQASDEEQIQIIGQRLFPLIESIEPENAAKVTGMLLEMDKAELLHLLESPESLKEKVQEAMVVLSEVGPEQQPQQQQQQQQGQAQ